MLIDFQKKGKNFEHTWSRCVGAGRAREGLRADWQQQLKTVSEDCGFQYLRFHGLFHDDMGVYTEENGEEHYNFQYVDKLFDYILSCHMRPFVELGFMPKDMASGEGTIFWWKGNVTPPRSYKKWGYLVRRIVCHWVDRYGLEEVKNWYFEVWNEPNLDPFWKGSKSQYFELYKVTVNEIKAISPLLRVGGPATSNFVPDSRFDGERENTSVHATSRTDDIDSLDWKGVWISDFLRYCKAENLPLDFVSTHPYPTDFALDGHGEFVRRTRHRDSLYQDIQWLKNELQRSSYPNIEIHLTEWSSSPTSRDYSHDYLPAAAYIIRSNLQCAGMVDSLSYWVFTDIFEETGPGPKPFHGGFGMMNLQGIKKPAFHAYRMLHELGKEELARGDGWIFTRKKNSAAAVFYYYPNEYSSTVPMSIYPDQHIAQACQSIAGKKEFDFELIGLTPGSVYCLQTLSAKNIAVNLWNEMGAPSEISIAQEAQLKAQGEKLEYTEFAVDQKGMLRLHFALNAWSIAALKIME